LEAAKLEGKQEKRTWKLVEEQESRLAAIDASTGPPPKEVSLSELSVRSMTKVELGLCYCWLKKDEEEGCEKWWSKGSQSIQASFENGEIEGELTGLFYEGVEYPLAFCICKAKPKNVNSIDVVAVRRIWRRKGLGTAFAGHFMSLACEKGDEYYDLDALPGSMHFWKRAGFEFNKEAPPDPGHCDTPMRIKLTRDLTLKQLRRDSCSEVRVASRPNVKDS